MDVREKLNEFAELRGWNKNKLIGWSEAADFGEWLVKKLFYTCCCRAKQTVTPKFISSTIAQFGTSATLFAMQCYRL